METLNPSLLLAIPLLPLVAAVLLLIAIVAAISLTMRKRAGLKLQNIAKQVAVRREDRVRIIKMPAEGSANPAGTEPASTGPSLTEPSLTEKKP